MVCIYCGGKTAIKNSRFQKRNNQKWRRRQCLKCNALFTTHEAVDLSSSLLVGSKPFLQDMLFTEVLLALQDTPNNYIAAREVTNTVIQQLLRQSNKPAFEPKQISLATSKVLKRFNKRAWLRYIAEHPSVQTVRTNS